MCIRVSGKRRVTEHRVDYERLSCIVVADLKSDDALPAYRIRTLYRFSIDAVFLISKRAALPNLMSTCAYDKVTRVIDSYIVRAVERKLDAISIGPLFDDEIVFQPAAVPIEDRVDARIHFGFSNPGELWNPAAPVLEIGSEKVTALRFAFVDAFWLYLRCSDKSHLQTRRFGSILSWSMIVVRLGANRQHRFIG